jgi:site-specific DNA-methyltransferase (adenine-specific)
VILADIAEKCGFVVDEIVVCRKANTSGQQLKAYPYLGTTLRESIVCLKKSK